MKKILISLIASMFILSSSLSFSAEFSGGVKIGYGQLNGTDKTNSRSSGEKDVSSAFPALFLEAGLPIEAPINLSLGIEYIPLETTVDIANTTSGGDYEATLKNHLTLYLQGSKEINGETVFGKIGYVNVDISNAKSSTQTITSADSSASGYVIGVGIQKEISSPFSDYVRIGFDYIDYGSVSAKSSSTNYSADADAYALYLSFGKKF